MIDMDRLRAVGITILGTLSVLCALLCIGIILWFLWWMVLAMVVFGFVFLGFVILFNGDYRDEWIINIKEAFARSVKT